MPIPTLPLLIMLNTSPLPLLAVNISSLTPVCVTEIPVPVPLLFISNRSVVKTFVSRVVESPNIVKLEVVKSPFISTLPREYVDKSTDNVPSSLIMMLVLLVLSPTFIPPKLLALAFLILIIPASLSVSKCDPLKYEDILVILSTLSILVFNSSSTLITKLLV